MILTLSCKTCLAACSVFLLPFCITQTHTFTWYTHRSTGTLSLSTWAELMDCRNSESVLRGSCQALIFGMYWMWGSGIIDVGLAGVKRREGRTSERQTWCSHRPLKPPIRLGELFIGKGLSLLTWTCLEWLDLELVSLVVQMMAKLATEEKLIKYFRCSG